MASFASFSGEDGFGVGVAVVAHGGLAALLAWHAATEIEPIKPPERIDVSLATEISLESTAPDPSAEPAASFAPVVTDLPQPPQEETLPPPDAPRAEPTTTPRGAPTSRPTPRASTPPRPTPTRTAPPRPESTPTRRSGPSEGFQRGFQQSGQSDGNGESGSPAETFGPTQRAALNSAISRQLARTWRGTAPSGVDAELLVSTVRWQLNRDGSLRGEPRCTSQRGINQSNRPQADIHCERAIRAVRRAAPFNLPEQFYSRWDDLEWDFDRRL